MTRTLIDLRKAIRGLVEMSQTLDSMYISIQNGLVPQVWENVAYPSLKPLMSWFNDLRLRCEFMRNWLLNGQPICFWISGFFFPQGFLTGTLQTHSRKYRIEIDHISFGFKVLKQTHDEIKEHPKVQISLLFFITF
jgi:dynein heavy chain, axonemal